MREFVVKNDLIFGYFIDLNSVMILRF